MARVVTLLLMGFGQRYVGGGVSAGEHRGGAQKISKVCQFCCGREPGREEAAWRGRVCRRMCGKGAALPSYVVSVDTMLVPAGVCVCKL